MGLYPTFEMPEAAADDAAKRTYKPSLFFDFEAGDFRLDSKHTPVLASGKEAFCQWCVKQCLTERYTRLAYSGKVGVEFEKAIRGEVDRAAVESHLERTITEALLVNPATEYVKDFSFSWPGGDHVAVTFLVKGHEWDETELTVEMG